MVKELQEEGPPVKVASHDLPRGPQLHCMGENPAAWGPDVVFFCIGSAAMPSFLLCKLEIWRRWKVELKDCKGRAWSEPRWEDTVVAMLGEEPPG